jgi:hypothetical protein
MMCDVPSIIIIITIIIIIIIKYLSIVVRLLEGLNSTEFPHNRLLDNDLSLISGSTQITSFAKTFNFISALSQVDCAGHKLRRQGVKATFTATTDQFRYLL